MPIYQYHCNDCGDARDYLTDRDRNPESCENCGSENLTRSEEPQQVSFCRRAGRDYFHGRPKTKISVGVLGCEHHIHAIIICQERLPNPERN